MGELSKLQPQAVWHYFEQILEVPRPSKHEDQMIEFMLNFAKEHNLESKKDKAGNILIKKPGSPGMEDRKTVVLQSHLDMVGEKNKNVDHNFETDPIQAYVDGNWVKAKGTTLGADDGIGIAVEMALLASRDIAHPPLECLFTVDEETGLTGAFAMESGFFDGRILINLDSEDEGEIFIGCAGGIDTLAYFKYDKEEIRSGSVAVNIGVDGLKGGHSGDEIHKGFGNSNKIINRFLYEAMQDYDLRVHKFEGGNKRNAIPRDAYAILTVKQQDLDGLKQKFDEYAATIKAEIGVTEPGMQFNFDQEDLPDFVIDKSTQERLVKAVYAAPHGVHAWSPDIEDMVETSTNFATIKFMENEEIQIHTSQRSSLDSGKEDIAAKNRTCFELAGARVEHTGGYPGWAPNVDSEILKISEQSYKDVFGKEPVVRAIHAGLECGLFLEKYPDLDMISIGPDMEGVHSPDEKVNIPTVKMWWDHLLDILKRITKR